MHVLLMYSTHTPHADHLKRLKDVHPSISVSVANSEQEAIEQVQTAEVIFGHRYLRQCLPHARRLRWVQTTAGGVDRLPCRELARMDVTLTRMTVASPVIARHATTLAWAITRRIPEALARQQAGHWDKEFDWPPLPQTAVVFGTGSIGRAIARQLRADGITVYGVKRTLDGSAGDAFERVYDRTTWRDVLPHVDWCILALPHTPETRGLFDEEVMRQLPAHAVLVNVGRGETVVTDDLRRVLREGHLSGAALDVIHPTPLEADDPIWHTPRLLITPHVAAHFPERGRKIEEFCEEQLARYVAEKPLRSRVALAACGAKTQEEYDE